MAGLGPLQLTFAQLQALLSTQYAAVATTPASTGKGSTLGAIFNANALAVAQLEQQAAYENNIARLATSFGADVDSFVNPFGITRLVALASTGAVTFSTSSAVTANLVVPVGVLVQTASGLQFEVVPDATNANYSSTVNGYTITTGNSSVIATVQCQSTGSIGNVQAGTIVSFYSGPGSYAVAGVTTVTNASAFTNGTDPETDVALKARFTLAMQTGPVATLSALQAAAYGAVANIKIQVLDFYNGVTTPNSPGYVTICAWPSLMLSGSYALTPAQLTSLSAALQVVKAAGVSAIVPGGGYGSLYNIAVNASVKAAPGYTSANVNAAVITALNQYIGGYAPLSVAPFTTVVYFGGMIAAINAVPGVLYTTGVSWELNGAGGFVTTDFTMPAGCMPYFAVGGSTILNL